MALFLAFFNQAVASTAIINYAPALLQEVGAGGTRASTLASSLVSGAKLLGAVVGLALVDWVGRRRLLLAGSTLCTLALAGLAAAAALQGTVLLVAAMSAFVFAFRSVCGLFVSFWGERDGGLRRELQTCVRGPPGPLIGHAPLQQPHPRRTCSPEDAHREKNQQPPPSLISEQTPIRSVSWAPVFWVLLSELFSMAAKSPAASAATAALFATGAASDALFLTLYAALGAFSFALYALIAALGGLFVALAVPETAGRTLEQVQELLAAPGRRPARAQGLQLSVSVA